MNLNEYKERLTILLEQEVITDKSSDVALQAFKELLKILNTTELDQAEMLFTHLPMALTRMSNGENVEGPAKEIVNEIYDSPHFLIAKTQVEWIEENWNHLLPQEEKDYLYMHYSTVLTINVQGGVKR
ncbi:PRD domain-containing protein [Heyndrickxia sporothermodurans]|uniref:PRD domain-containing protein n=1 Tax=Heyndrickxia sporothermodurans TaxID=46224 RepID=UPI002E229A79|nr:PRD domain-containing protein [Heyndrickxia sporothermodurans]MED3655178.1 PRD domain-containing protein [Heyndrickxia sporothermodurans]